jgi:hypothetical protein
MASTKFTVIDGKPLARTLGQRLIHVADQVRDLFTAFGLRPYKVRIVRVRWAGGRRGEGAPVIEKTLDLLPTPLITDLSGLTEIVQPVGLDEVGGITLSEVSGRFTEDELRFVERDGTPMGADEEIFYEIEFPPVEGRQHSIRRRFFPNSAPFYAASRFQWSVRLEKAHEDRQRNGDYNEHLV